ncbi:tetracycline resistance ribosomal protection protein [Desulfosporosinus sp. PR]|uniref:tetracycline resistance ribosomal protection protein n=1 Tax=Candidatus Desulfosporosinus nitrosoreducens TaxID=3401928 RepID=UPI0027F604B4|nr:tetracycline resistance ribosomal protection protein [Desulfosporosinus sp. PR]MDQ7093609.1 tetracycline resistance ribosomal protection protein [Desulfosporosinus sp. PR]
MKIINLGILAHVDAGKTTVTESLLYKSGAIRSAGRVDKGTTITDSMSLEKQRGITIRSATISFEWADTKINLIDTPGHMDFIAEVERSLCVLDGAVLVISAKEGVQVQTRIIFQTLQKLKIPTLIFVNKLDRIGVNLEELYLQIREQLTPALLVMQSVSGAGSNDISITEHPGASEEMVRVLLDLDELLAEKYIMEQSISEMDYRDSFLLNIAACKLFPVFHGVALQNIGVEQLMDAMAQYLPAGMATDQGDSCAFVYKIDRDEQSHKRAFARIFGGSIKIRDTVTIDGKEEGIKIKSLETIRKGKIMPAEYVLNGDIAVLSNVQNLQIGDVIGVRSRNLPQVSLVRPSLQASVQPLNPGDRSQLIQALWELTEEDPLLHCEIDKYTEEIKVRLFGEIQREVIKDLLLERYRLNVQFSELITIYKERPKQAAEATIHAQDSSNPYCASVGLAIEPLPLGSGLVFESKVSYGYLNKSFQGAVSDSVQKACEEGLLGWEVTDLKVCFTYGFYFSPVSTPADFRHLTPLVVEKALRKAETELLEPFMEFELCVPKEYSSKAMYDLQQMRASVERIETKNSETILQGKIPGETSKSYQIQLISYTNGKGIFLTKLCGYDVYLGKPSERIKK